MNLSQSEKKSKDETVVKSRRRTADGDVSMCDSSTQQHAKS